MIKHVPDFPSLLSTPFAGETNALCWKRSLPGDFAAVVHLLGPGEGVVPLDEDLLRSLPSSALRSLGEGGRLSVQIAIDTMLADLALLREAGRDPVLNIIYSYPRDEDGGPIPTDVLSWHVDSAPIEADTWLCTYHGAPSEALDPEDAILKVSDPAIRAQLLGLYGGKEDHSFTEWLAENHYNLHYSARLGARPHSFGVHNLWRAACAWPDSPVPPCVHRAPTTKAPRLLLIS